jgi:hypothetical protein
VGYVPHILMILDHMLMTLIVADEDDDDEEDKHTYVLIDRCGLSDASSQSAMQRNLA